MRAVPVLVAALLVLSSPAMAMVAFGPVDGPVAEQSAPESIDGNGSINASETTNRLVLTDNVTAAYSTPAPDLGTALAGQDEAMRTDYDAFVLEERFPERSDDERRASIERSRERIEDRIDALDERERTAVARHASGETSEGALLRTLVRNHREAAELKRALDTLDERADAVPGYSFNDAPLEVQIEAHRSPVRERLEKTLQGYERADRSPDIVYVETSETGLTVSTIDNRRYVREAVRFDNRDPNRSDQFEDVSDAFYRSQEIYPWILDRDGYSPSPVYVPYSSIQLYTVDVSHTQGTLSAHLDGGTGNVYREVQQLHVDRLPAEEVGTWEDDGLEVRINRTPINGPIELTAVDNETGDPVDATVEVNGYRIGQTEDREKMWIIPPRTDYEVTVEDGNRSVNATVRAE